MPLKPINQLTNPVPELFNHLNSVQTNDLCSLELLGTERFDPQQFYFKQFNLA